MISVKEQIIKSFADTTGKEPVSVDSAGAAVASGDAHLVYVELRGGITGGMALVVEKDLALAVSSDILTKAAGRTFGRDEIDTVLAANTMGEILNIALGEYFMNRKNDSPVEIVSPQYGLVAAATERLENLSDRLRFSYQGREFDVYYRFS